MKKKKLKSKPTALKKKTTKQSVNIKLRELKRYEVKVESKWVNIINELIRFELRVSKARNELAEFEENLSYYKNYFTHLEAENEKLERHLKESEETANVGIC